MASVEESRRLDASVEDVWKVVSDPHHLPRWWPRTVRVEGVKLVPGVNRSRFTQVMVSERGNPVRADFRCVAATECQRLDWQQTIAGTPFERFLRASGLQIELDGSEEGTTVTLCSDQELRGLSRFGGPLMKSASRRTLIGALDGLEAALGGTGGGEEAGR